MLFISGYSCTNPPVLFVNSFVFCADLRQKVEDFTLVICGYQVTVDMKRFFSLGCQDDTVAPKRTGSMYFPEYILIIMERKMLYSSIDILDQFFLGAWNGKHLVFLSFDGSFQCFPDLSSFIVDGCFYILQSQTMFFQYMFPVLGIGMSGIQRGFWLGCVVPRGSLHMVMRITIDDITLFFFLPDH